MWGIPTIQMTCASWKAVSNPLLFLKSCQETDVLIFRNIPQLFKCLAMGDDPVFNIRVPFQFRLGSAKKGAARF